MSHVCIAGSGVQLIEVTLFFSFKISAVQLWYSTDRRLPNVYFRNTFLKGSHKSFAFGLDKICMLYHRRHVAWRDSVGVEGSRLGLKSECADIFHQSFFWLLHHTDEPQRGRNNCLWLQSRSVLSSFVVVLTSCRVNFHVYVVRSALQYSACRI